LAIISEPSTGIALEKLFSHADFRQLPKNGTPLVSGIPSAAVGRTKFKKIMEQMVGFDKVTFCKRKEVRT